LLGEEQHVPVRKTESRLPPNLQAADLGEAIVAPDGRCALVSFLTSPLVVNRENVYLVFVTDATLAAAAHSFEWTFTENAGPPIVENTEHGEISHVPKDTGRLYLTVRILSADKSEQAKLTFKQDVGHLNPLLEKLIAETSASPGPGVANPEVTRELVNNYSSYYQAIQMRAPESGDGFQRFVFSMVLDGALQRTPNERKQHIDKLADSVNNQQGDFATLAAQGVGVCGIRLALLAMTLHKAAENPAPLLDWTELPESSLKRDMADEQLRERLASLEENARIDLFNLARLPKSNINRCAHILEALRDRYFGGTNFNDVLTGMSGTRAQVILRHYQKGPLLRS
jgi:hypothetical protein